MNITGIIFIVLIVIGVISIVILAFKIANTKMRIELFLNECCFRPLPDEREHIDKMKSDITKYNNSTIMIIVMIVIITIIAVA